MINLILQEGKNYLESDEFNKSLMVVANNFALTKSELDYFSMAVHEVISGNIPEEQFTRELRDLSEIKRDKIDRIYAEAKEKIFTPFKKRLGDILQSTPVPVSQPQTPDLTGISTLRQNAPAPAFTPPQPTPEPLTKEHMISQIENPPRTVIKRYVLEHEPITDPEHLIDDTIDERPKLS